MKIGDKIKEALKLSEVKENIRKMKVLKYLCKNNPKHMQLDIKHSLCSDNNGYPIPCLSLELHKEYILIESVRLKPLSAYKIS